MKLEDKDFLRLQTYMKENYGIDLSKKRSLIEGRLGNVIQKKGFSDFGPYIDYALSEPEEVILLVSRLSTNYSFFMREEQHYRHLTQKVLPEWTAKIKDHDLRIWSAGCSSGEEAYTAAMVVNDYLGPQKDRWDASILATDISEKVLGLARAGVFPEDELRNLPERYKTQYFTMVEQGLYQISPELRKQVVFANLNLMDAKFPFRKSFHVIFCRNVMIYFDTPTRERLVNHFFQWLHPGGYLFIGLSETLSNLKSNFEYISPAIYRRPL